MQRSDLITVDKEIMGGTPVFQGSRVPVKTLFDYLSANHTLEFFLRQYPTVERDTALGVLRLSGEVLGVADEAVAR